MTNKSLTILLVFLMIGCSNTNTVKIGYEQDEGNIIDINSGDVESTNVIKKYFDAYIVRDYETIQSLEHDDVTFYGPNGELVVGIEEHYKLSKEFLTAYPNTQWTINWSVSTDVMFDEIPAALVTSLDIPATVFTLAFIASRAFKSLTKSLVAN